MNTVYKKHIEELNKCVHNIDYDNGQVKDSDEVHIKADSILREIALDTGLTKAQRKTLVKLYDQVVKFYA